ncbi:MAG: MFS transporter, partial [Candidatus Omnitrophica bacterium]|nr:MFS transporter [Candidatus Omnitrophota bacterium]
VPYQGIQRGIYTNGARERVARRTGQIDYLLEAHKSVERAGLAEDISYRDSFMPFNPRRGLFGESEEHVSSFVQKARKEPYLRPKAEEILEGVLSWRLPKRARVIDLMSGYNTYVPDEVEALEVVGVGLNKEELQNNPRLTSFLVQDLNENPHLPFKEDYFDAVIMTCGMAYLTKPRILFSSVAKLLKPGGMLFVAFNDECYENEPSAQEWKRMGWFEERAEFTKNEIIASKAFEHLQQKRTYYCQFPDAIRPLDMFSAYRGGEFKKDYTIYSSFLPFLPALYELAKKGISAINRRNSAGKFNRDDTLQIWSKSSEAENEQADEKAKEIDSKENSKRNLLLLGSTNLIENIAGRMMLAVLPLFVASLGGGGIALGLISGLNQGLGGIVRLFSGIRSDKSSRKISLVSSGYIVSGAMKVLLALCSSWLMVLPVRIVDGLGLGWRSPARDAMVANGARKKERGRAFGTIRMLGSVGAAVGSALAVLLFWTLQLDYHVILFIAGGISLLAAIPLFLVKDHPHRKRHSQKFHIKDVIPIFKKLDPEFQNYLTGVNFFSLASSFSMFMFFILSANIALVNILGPGLAVAFPLLFYALSSIVSSALAIPAGILFDKIGGNKALFLGYLLYAVSCLGFIWADNLVWFGTLFIIYGMSSSLTEGNQRAYTAKFAEEEMQGTIAGVFQSTKAMTSLVGGI